MKKKMFSALLVLCICIAAALPVRAAEVMHMDLSNPTANAGDEVTVVLMAAREGGTDAYPLSSLRMELSFDPAMLNYQNCVGGMGNLTAEVDNGRLILEDHPLGEGTALFLAELHFTAAQVGNSEVNVVSCQAKGEYGEDLTCACGKAEVCVNVRTEQDVSLYSLVFNMGELTPAFEPERTLYHLTVPADCTYVTVSAHPSNYWATSYVDGHASLQPGENTVTITVTSGDGTASRVYTVLVYRGTPPPESEPISVFAPEVETAAPEQAEVVVPELPLIGENPENGGEETPAPEPAPQETAEPEQNVDALVQEAYIRGRTEKEVEAALATTALQNAEERVDTLERAAKGTTIAAMAELVIIVLLACILWKRKRRADNEDEWEENDSADV